MSVAIMDAGGANFGSAGFGAGPLDGVRRFFIRVLAAVAIAFLVFLLLILLVPMAVIGLVYLFVRSVFTTLQSGARQPSGDAPMHQPIPDADDEGRENVRVRRADGE
ncbi:MAG: hypothetical protein ACREJD_15330 [Phycisphaerales bacterium]